MKKRTNPRRKPATMADVKRAKRDALHEAVGYAMTVLFTVLLDKHGATQQELQQYWAEVEQLSDSIERGYVNLADLKRVLLEEYDIQIGG